MKLFFLFFYEEKRMAFPFLLPKLKISNFSIKQTAIATITMPTWFGEEDK